jgi:TonB family protein
MLITPLVIAAHFLALVTFMHVRLLPESITVGYEGPERYETEISIIDNRPAASRAFSRQRNTLILQDIEIEGEDAPRSTRKKDAIHKPVERPQDNLPLVDVPQDYSLRQYPSRATAPYRQDYVILRMVKPEYPLDALLNEDEGYVLVEAYINYQGRVSEAYVRSSFGPQSFENASLEAVRQFLFRPVMESGKPMSFWVSFLVRFRINR